MDDDLAVLVRQRARGACEYCQMPDHCHPGTFEIEHIVPKQHGGESSAANLAYACLRCNRAKGPNLAGLDRTRKPARMIGLFHPRRHRWAAHFRWKGPLLVARTPRGRVTIQVLNINDPVRVQLREWLILEGEFPPS
jgi:hypothetical protein